MFPSPDSLKSKAIGNEWSFSPSSSTPVRKEGRGTSNARATTQLIFATKSNIVWGEDRQGGVPKTKDTPRRTHDSKEPTVHKKKICCPPETALHQRWGNLQKKEICPHMNTAFLHT
jgi:hypothetical protein